MQRREESVEGDNRLVGIRGTGKLVNKLRYDLIELLACKGTFQCVVGRRFPAAHQSGYFRRLAESHHAQAVEGFAIVSLGRKDQAGLVAAARPRLLEKVRVVSLHIAEMNEHGIGKIVAPRVAGKSGKTVDSSAVGRQG